MLWDSLRLFLWVQKSSQLVIYRRWKSTVSGFQISMWWFSVMWYVRLPSVSCSAWSDWLADLSLTSVSLKEHSSSTPLQQCRDTPIMIQQMPADCHLLGLWMKSHQLQLNVADHDAHHSAYLCLPEVWSISCYAIKCRALLWAAGRGCKPAPAVLSTLCCLHCRWPLWHDPV